MTGKNGFRPIIPAANGTSYEVIPSEINWVPVLDHECSIGPWFATEQEARTAAEKQLENEDG